MLIIPQQVVPGLPSCWLNETVVKVFSDMKDIPKRGLYFDGSGSVEEFILHYRHGVRADVPNSGRVVKRPQARIIQLEVQTHLDHNPIAIYAMATNLLNTDLSAALVNTVDNSLNRAGHVPIAGLLAKDWLVANTP